MGWEARYAGRLKEIQPSAIMALLKSASGPGTINFASGLPDAAAFPTEALRRIVDEVLAEDPLALQYGPMEGYEPLREWVAGWLSRTGPPLTAENILITHGSQQGIDLIARLFIEPGDTVLLENPSYLAAIQVFQSFEARFATVPLEDDGLDVDAVESAIAAHRPKLLYTLPNFQNPTGLTLSPAKRERLTAIGVRHGLVVVEDDA